MASGSKDQDAADAAQALPRKHQTRVGALPKPAECLLRDLGRWGYLTVPQAAGLRGHHTAHIRLARRQLERRHLAIALPLAKTGGPQLVCALTDAGRRALRRLPDPPPQMFVYLDHIDHILAAVDLALDLKRRGEGEWLTWPEYRRLHTQAIAGGTPLPQLEFAPSGILHDPNGTYTPIWVIVLASRPGQLVASVRALFRRRELEPGRVYALPGLVPWVLERRLIIDDVRPWQPPHLHGRPPLHPGWARPFTEPNVQTALSEAGAAAGSGEATGSGRQLRPLGHRQISVLLFLDRFGYATPLQLARATGTGQLNVAHVLAKLEAAGRVQRQRGTQQGRHRGKAQEDVWSATPAGLAAIGSQRRALRPAPLHRAHSLALVDLAHKMEAETGGKWEAERELSHETLVDFRIHGRQTAFRGKTPPPDGRLTLPDGRRILIQLQLSHGAAPAQCAYARRQRLQGLGDELWFVCTPEVAPRYRREIKPHEVDLIRVLEWTPPDRSAGVREPNASVEARRRAQAASLAAGRGPEHGGQ